jgi:hypothetical protein
MQYKSWFKWFKPREHAFKQFKCPVLNVLSSKYLKIYNFVLQTVQNKFAAPSVINLCGKHLYSELHCSEGRAIWNVDWLGWWDSERDRAEGVYMETATNTSTSHPAVHVTSTTSGPFGTITSTDDVT